MSAEDEMSKTIARDTGWFVENFDAESTTLSFVHTDRQTRARQPFLDGRWNREGLERREVPLESLAAQMQRGGSEPAINFIWHASYCCSTLIAELLDLPGRSMSLREPLVLVSVADAKRAGQFGGAHMPPRLLELVLCLLARTANSERVLVKPSNFANNLIQDAARRSQGKVLFLYADLESFLTSIEKGGDGLGKYVRRLFGNLARDNGAQVPWPLQDVLHMSDLEIAALCWHMQLAQFERAAQSLDEGRAAALDCTDFLADPATTLRALAAFFELDWSEREIASVVDGPVLKRHAKRPSTPFGPDLRRRQSDDVRRRLGPDLPRIVEWSHRACPDTRRSTVLSRTRLTLHPTATRSLDHA